MPGTPASLYKNAKTNDDLKQEAVRFVNCRTVVWIITSNVHQHRRRCRNPWRYIEDTKHWSLGKQKPLLLLQNLLKASNQPHNSLSSWCCSQLVPINVHRHPDESFSRSMPLSQLQTLVVLSLGTGSGSWASSRALCFLISTRWSNVSF